MLQAVILVGKRPATGCDIHLGLSWGDYSVEVGKFHTVIMENCLGGRNEGLRYLGAAYGEVPQLGNESSTSDKGISEDMRTPSLY